MNATEQIALLRRACEMVFDASGNGGDMSDRDWLAKWKATGFPWKIAIDQCRDALSATATPPDDDVAKLKAMIKDAAPVASALEDAERERKLMEQKLITCGVAATHPDATLTTTKECYAKTWNSPQAEAVRKLRQERDDALAKLAAANGELETERIRLAACGVIAGCNTPETYALNMRMDESYKCSSIDAVAAAVRREMDLRDKLEAAQKELADIHAAKTEPEFKAEGLRVYQRTTVWSEIASCRAECTAKDIADALNGGKP